ncbi:MAG: ral secretion pathway protein [Abditibacteriota bacterium]|nr:ral secretion pathway protein [Abditibacteriota bacterium]
MWLCVAVWLCATSDVARAQLANSFYTVTGVETRILPNAVQLVIRTDGSVVFGGNLDDWILIDEETFQPKPVTALRLRLVGARAKLPAFVDVGAYPIEGALVTLGRDDLTRPYFSARGYAQPEPRVDIQLRFYVPVLVQRFVVDRSGGSSSESAGEDDITFKRYLEPLDASVELGSDRRSIVITVVTDRVDTTGATRIQRVKPEDQKHRVDITRLDRPQSNFGAVVGAQSTLNDELANARFRVDVLHAPLIQVLARLAELCGVPFTMREPTADIELSMMLPSTSLPEFLLALETGYGLMAAPRASAEGGGFLIGRGSAVTVTERLLLKYLVPERARLLFPDFLLPALRVDSENNALVVSSTPAVIARLKSDLARLDVPRRQVRVEASVFEISNTDDYNLAMRAAFVGREFGAGLDTTAGQYSFRVERNALSSLRATLEALSAKGQARLRARPFVLVASGGNGVLFLGQTRFVPVLRVRSGRQDVQPLRLQVGYELSVTPRAGADGDILLNISPRVSTVDDIERGTGLPTLGIREVSSTLRVRSDDSIVVAGLDSDLSSRFDRGPLPTNGRNATQTHLIVLVSARVV